MSEVNSKKDLMSISVVAVVAIIGIVLMVSVANSSGSSQSKFSSNSDSYGFAVSGQNPYVLSINSGVSNPVTGTIEADDGSEYRYTASIVGTEVLTDGIPALDYETNIYFQDLWDADDFEYNENMDLFGKSVMFDPNNGNNEDTLNLILLNTFVLVNRAQGQVINHKGQSYTIEVLGGNDGCIETEPDTINISVSNGTGTVFSNEYLGSFSQLTGLSFKVDDISLSNINEADSIITLTIDNTNVEFTIGQPKEVVYNNITYTVTIISAEVGECIAYNLESAIIKINGDTRTIAEGDFRTLGGLSVYVRDVFIQNIGGDDISVNLAIGAEKLEFYEDGTIAKNGNTFAATDVQAEYVKGNGWTNIGKIRIAGNTKKNNHPYQSSAYIDPVFSAFTINKITSTTSVQYNCTDSDNGKDVFVKGITTGVQSANPAIGVVTLPDLCGASKSMTEYYCGTDKLVYSENYNCDVGCSNGACTSFVNSSNSTPPKSCTDSDGGLNYYVRGTSTGYFTASSSGQAEFVENLEEYCFCSGGACTDKRVNELVCVNGYITQNSYNCSNGCSNGACVLIIDSDGDGYNSTVDCNDTNASAYRNVALYPDSDLDSYSLNSAVTKCIGTSIPSKFLVSKSATVDCNDTNVSIWIDRNGYKDFDSDTYTTGSAVSVCSGNALPTKFKAAASSIVDCNDTNSSKWQSRTVYKDADLDGYTLSSTSSICIGAALPSIFKEVASSIVDCNDTNSSKWQSKYLYSDADLDGYTLWSTTTICVGAIPPNFKETSSSILDCNDTNSTIYRNLQIYPDSDNDSYTAQSYVYSCVGANAPNGYKLSLSSIADCNDADANKFKLWSVFADTDNDGYTTGSSVNVCGGMSLLPTGYRQTKSTTDDCSPNNNSTWINRTFYQDSDGDGWTSGSASVCSNNVNPPAGYTLYATLTDCNATNNLTWRFLNGYPDPDNDGYASSTNISVCSGTYLPTGFKSSVSMAGSNPIIDCAPSDSTKWRQANFYADVDKDGYSFGPAVTLCSGAVPVGYLQTNTTPDCNATNNLTWRFLTYYRDEDKDGFTLFDLISLCVGNPSGAVGGIPGPGYSSGYSGTIDCNDKNNLTKPSAYETCNGVDDNCNGQIDENVKLKWYIDFDSDGFGNYTGNFTLACTKPAGYSSSSNATDCNDKNNAIKPGAVELCNGINDDCDYSIDEGFTSIAFFKDTDGDGYGNPSWALAVSNCAKPTGYSANNTDCNDESSSVYASVYCKPDFDGDGYAKNAPALLCGTNAANNVISQSGKKYICNYNGVADCDDTNSAKTTIC